MTRDFMLLNLWPERRRTIIERLDFYYEQALSRVIGQFNNIEEEADQFARESYDRRGQRFDPDYHDEGEVAEAAWDDGVNHYMLLSGMRQQMIFAVAAGMYHEWDKQLREWLENELGHNFKLDKLKVQIWKQDIGSLFDMLDGWGWNLKVQPFHDLIDACRLVVNVYKHGAGSSLDQLAEKYGQYLRNYSQGSGNPWGNFVRHDQLQLDEDGLRDFFEALKAFWMYVPAEAISSSAASVPAWFEKALQPEGKQRSPQRGGRPAS